MGIIEKKEDKLKRTFLSWISGKDFATLDDALAWLGNEAEKLGVEPHLYLRLVELLIKTSGCEKEEDSGAGLYEFLRVYNEAKHKGNKEFPENIRAILVGIQIKAVGKALSMGEKGKPQITAALSARFLEQILFGENLIKDFPWIEIVKACKKS